MMFPQVVAHIQVKGPVLDAETASGQNFCWQIFLRLWSVEANPSSSSSSSGGSFSSHLYLQYQLSREVSGVNTGECMEDRV